MRILGVDPGKTGAFALLNTISRDIDVKDVPTIKANGRTVVADPAISALFEAFAPDVAFVERVHSMPKQGVASSFDFGVTVGVIRGVIAALGIPVVFVTPQEWKRHFRLSADKNEARVRATQLFPDHAMLFTPKGSHGRAEAALLTLFGMERVSQDTQPDDDPF